MLQLIAKIFLKCVFTQTLNSVQEVVLNSSTIIILLQNFDFFQRYWIIVPYNTLKKNMILAGTIVTTILKLMNDITFHKQTFWKWLVIATCSEWIWLKVNDISIYIFKVFNKLS